MLYIDPIVVVLVSFPDPAQFTAIWSTEKQELQVMKKWVGAGNKITTRWQWRELKVCRLHAVYTVYFNVLQFMVDILVMFLHTLYVLV